MPQIAPKLPTYSKLRPYNYSRVKRLSRMSGKTQEEVLKTFNERYEQIVREKQERGEDVTHLDSYQLSELYEQVTKILGVNNEPLTVQASAEPATFEANAHLVGFDVAVAEKYLQEVGYTSNFISRLKNSPRVELVQYPKYLHPMYKKKFSTFFERCMLEGNHRKEHSICFYARTVADFITQLVKAKKDPFTKLIMNASVLPMSALQSLFRYKYNVVARYAHALEGFKSDKAKNDKIAYTKVSSRKLQNFSAFGCVMLDMRPKQTQESYEKQFYAVLSNMGDIGKRLIKEKKQIKLAPEQGVSLILSVVKENGKPRLCLKYRIDIRPQFSFDNVENIDGWINKQVIAPSVNHFNSNAMYHSRIKVS